MMERRRFLRVVSGAGMALGVGACASVLPLTMRPTGGTLRLPLDAHPDLARAGGSLRVRTEGEGLLVYILALDDGTFAALSPICTHQGCTVGVEGVLLVCPCHGSTYTREGNVVRGPAALPLTRYATRVAAERELVVELGSAG
ncbi:MAG: Rieske (2Fe-2S) protein [Gemmatimonadota bacterium]